MVVSLVALNAVANAAANYYVDLIAFLFILPSALFSGYAGHMADVYSKKKFCCRQGFRNRGHGARRRRIYYPTYRIHAADCVLMGLHAAFFSPAKYGILPEMLPIQELSRGNGLLEMSTFVAIILGTSLGGAVYSSWKYELPWVGVAMVAIAVLGTIAGLAIAPVPPSGNSNRFNFNPFGEIWQGLKRLRIEKPLWFTVLGISYFWFLGALVQLDMLFFGKELLGLMNFTSASWAPFSPSASALAARRRAFVGRQNRARLGASGFGRHGGVFPDALQPRRPTFGLLWR
jgi:acyl-[acyl-carrier-protein]-phospholipid O-acyltransferase/long-chain-fatty-acid--[acyl-carrier-protein] ligase